jgi:hypothetical protein
MHLEQIPLTTLNAAKQLNRRDFVARLDWQ